MEELLPKYNIDFSKNHQEHFFLHKREKTDGVLPAFTKPHSHNYYCLSFLYEGKMPYFADMTNSEVEGPAMLMLNIDQVHVHPAIQNCKVVSIGFSADFIHGHRTQLADYMERLFSQTHVDLAEETLTELNKYIQLISFEEKKGRAKDPAIIECLLSALLIRCAGLADQSLITSNNRRNLFADYKSLINDHYKLNHQVKFYADKLNVTPEVLNQTVRNACKKTPKQLVDERLLTEAKRLLYWSDITAREVAWELGFETDGYFNRFFKKHTGVTPKEYQKTTRTS